MQVKENDNTITQDLNRCVTWQYDGATRLKGIVDLIGDYFAQSSTSFFNALNSVVCDIDSVGDFGLTVWGKILNCQRPLILMEGQSEPQQLSPSLYRNILKARARLLASRGTVVDYKDYIQLAFNGHFTVHDDCAMGLTFTATASATAEEIALAEQHPDVAFIWPCGVRSSSVQESGVFSLTNESTLTALDNSYFHKPEEPEILNPFYFQSTQSDNYVSILKSGTGIDFNFEYSFDNSNWMPFEIGSTKRTYFPNIGDKMYIRAGENGNPTLNDGANNFVHFSSSQNNILICKGDVRFLLNRNPTRKRLPRYCFMGLFNFTGIKTLPDLTSKLLSPRCYESMFQTCTKLKIRESGSGEAWSIPEDVDIHDALEWNLNMFVGTGGTFKGDPVPGVTYYVYE